MTAYITEEPQSKPHLKLKPDGSLAVVGSPVVCRSEGTAWALVVAHHGSARQFAARFGFSENAVYAALHWAGDRRAGEPSTIRQVLGLRSAPSERSRRLIAYHAQKRKGL